MGDIADMMLEGILCESCGTYIGEGDGFPQKCSSCAEADDDFDDYLDEDDLDEIDF